MVFFLMGVSLAILVSLDARLLHHVLPNGHAIIIIVIVLVLLLKKIAEDFLGNPVIRMSKLSIAYVCIMVAYTIGAFGEYADSKEIIMSYLYITFIFLNGMYIKKYDCLSAFISVSYFSIFAFFILIIVINRIDLVTIVKNINLVDFFSTNYYKRSRYAFGFYNPNALGNICTCELSLVFYLIMEKGKSIWKSTLFKGGVLLGACFFFVALLSSGSRSAVVSFIFFIAFFMLINNDYYSQLNVVISKFLKGLAVLIVLTVVLARGISFFIDYYLNSGRYKSFSNFRLVSGARNYLFGLGLFVPGDIRRIHINGYRGDTLDNYYIYVYMTMGIVGAVLIISSIFYLFWKVYKNKNMPMGTYIVALFAELLIYGTAETCVIYYIFISSMIVMSIVFGFCNKYYLTQRPQNQLETRFDAK